MRVKSFSLSELSGPLDEPGIVKEPIAKEGRKGAFLFSCLFTRKGFPVISFLEVFLISMGLFLSSFRKGLRLSCCCGITKALLLSVFRIELLLISKHQM